MPDPAIDQLIAKLSVYERNLRSMVDRVVAIENKLGIRSLSVFETVVQWPSRIQPQPCDKCDGELVDGERHECKAESRCTRRHLTEAEEALCDYFARGCARWDWSAPMLYASELGNIVRNERRQQTKGAEECGVDCSRPNTPSAPADPCSCDEALELRRKLEKAEDRIYRALSAAGAFGTFDPNVRLSRVLEILRG